MISVKSKLLSVAGYLLVFWVLVCGSAVAADRVYYLSAEGAKSDADISEGSVSFGTDNTTAIQKVLDKAQKHPILVYWDGKYSVTGLKVYSNTTIIALNGCGAILRNNSSRAIIENAHLSFSEYKNSNITIQGGIWNGNGYNDQLNPAQKHDLPEEGWIAGLRFFGVENLVLRDITVFRPRTFSIHAARVKDVLIQNIVIDVGENAPINCDGIHFNGPATNITVRDGRIRAKDDHVAFNAEDCLDPSSDHKTTYYAKMYGDISDVTVENIRLNGGEFGIRLLSGGSRIDRVAVRNIHGSTRGYWLIADNFWQAPQWLNNTGNGNIGTAVFENIQVETTGISSLGRDGVNAACANINTNAERLIFRNVIRNEFPEKDFPSILVSGKQTLVKSIVVDGYHSTMDERWAEQVTSHVEVRDARVESLQVTESSLLVKGKSKNCPLIRVTKGGTINRLQLGMILAENIDSVVWADGEVAHSSATNIQHSGGNEGTFVLEKDGELVLSNYLGKLPKSGKGKLLFKGGDALKY